MNESSDMNEAPALSIEQFLRLRAQEDSGFVSAALLHWPTPGTFVGGVRQYLERFDPARLQREVRARRAIVDEIQGMLDADPPQPVHDALRRIQRHLAQAYTTSPYYRDEWTPGGMPASPAANLEQRP